MFFEKIPNASILEGVMNLSEKKCLLNLEGIDSNEFMYKIDFHKSRLRTRFESQFIW